MYLSSLVIENFRAIRHVDISFERSVTVLIGENGCGKSSILNALEAVMGRNVPKDGFDIKASDFHRPSFSEPQAEHMRIVLGFKGGLGKDLAAGLSENENEELYLKYESGDADEDEASLNSIIDAEASYGSLQKFRNSRFTVSSEADPQAKSFNFFLCIDSYLYSGLVTSEFKFENSLHEEICLNNPLDYLITLKTVVPFLRIRSGSLLPPVHRDAEHRPAQANVDSVFSQAYSELTENAQYSAEEFIAKNRDDLELGLENLEKILVHKSSEDLEDDLENSFDVSISGSSGSDKYTKKLIEENRRSLAVIQERLSAPLSTSSVSAAYNSGDQDYNRFSALLRGTGARSLAMLAFADSFFKAQAEGAGGEFSEADYSPVLSVEDPDAYLHPLMLTSVWSLIDRMSPQRIVSTNSSDLLSAISLTSMRRIVRSSEGIAKVFNVCPGHMHVNDLRRIAYHLRIRRGTALFMRFWLLVEGETEYWLLPEIARSMGYDLWSEGIEFVEFAQCGLGPLAELANELGISWHLLADGDKAGQAYGKHAAPFAAKAGLGRITVLEQDDIETCFWENGYEHVFRRIAGPAQTGSKKGEKAKDIIKRAIRVASKPGLALALGQAMQEPGSAGVPAQLSSMICDAVRTARRQGRSRN